MFESLKLDGLIQLQEKIDARVMRERALIFLTALAFVFMLWNFVVQSSIDKHTQETRAQLDLLATQRTTMQTQIAAATQNLLNDPDKQKKAQITQLQTDISGLENQLHSVSQNLIKADQLPQALQEVLEKTSQLTLLEVKTLPAKELQFVASTTTNNTQPTPVTEETSAGVFQHVVELRVSGSYSQVVQLLVALEGLPWRFYWQGLDYSVDQYPNAEVILRVYTLSSEEGLFGV
jgi:MSHA biogenesis protein MshJ